MNTSLRVGSGGVSCNIVGVYTVQHIRRWGPVLSWTIRTIRRGGVTHSHVMQPVHSQGIIRAGLPRLLLFRQPCESLPLLPVSQETQGGSGSAPSWMPPGWHPGHLLVVPCHDSGDRASLQCDAEERADSGG